MQCNCDLDKWEPNRSTGHSDVCQVHKATIHQSALDRQNGEAPLHHLVVLYSLLPFTFSRSGHNQTHDISGYTIYSPDKKSYPTKRCAAITFEGNSISMHSAYTQRYEFNLADPDLLPKIKELLNDPTFLNASDPEVAEYYANHDAG